MSNGLTFYVRIKELGAIVLVSFVLSILLILFPVPFADVLFLSPVVIIPLIYAIVCFFLDRDFHGFKPFYIIFDLVITTFSMFFAYGLSWLGIISLSMLLGW